MTFLNPLVLFGLAAAAIPLIIHLFNFRKPQRVDFSSLTFVKELQKTTMQRVRIKQWLLLLLRTLAIAALVLAFARPTLTGALTEIGGRATTSMALVVDNSLSMTLRDAQGGYLEQAQAIARSLIDLKEPADEVFLIPTADNMAVAPAAYTNQGPVLDATNDLGAAHGAVPLSVALDRAADALAEATNLNKEVYLITDLQQRTLIDTLGQVTWPEGVRPYLIPVGTRAYANVAVTGVRVVSRIVEVGQPVRIEATLVNYGSEAIEGYVASLFLEGQRVAQGTADLPPGQVTTVRFAATPQQRGWLRGLVQIEADAFEYDNLRHFTLNVPEQRRVLVVQGEGARVDYLALALSSDLTRGRVAFVPTTIPERDLAATSLGGYDAVVLVGPRTLSSGEVVALAQYVEGGGGLMVFPGEGAQVNDYNALLAALGGGQVAGFSGAPGPGAIAAAFDRVDLEHPLFEGVFDRQPRGAQGVESPEIYFAMNYTPGRGDEQTLIRLSNRFGFMQELRHGRGAVFVLAVAPDPRWSDLPVRGLFIPFLYRSMYYLSASESVAGEQLTVGVPGELRLAGEAGRGALELVGPDGEAYTPEQRALFGSTLLQTDASLRTPGVYDVRAGDRVVRRVALNLDQRESDLTLATPEEAQARLEALLEVPVRVLAPTDGGAGVVAALNAERTGLEIWNVFLLLALVFLVAEMLVARQWRPETVGA